MLKDDSWMKVEEHDKFWPDPIQVDAQFQTSITRRIQEQLPNLGVPEKLLLNVLYYGPVARCSVNF